MGRTSEFMFFVNSVASGKRNIGKVVSNYHHLSITKKHYEVAREEIKPGLTQTNQTTKP